MDWLKNIISVYLAEVNSQAPLSNEEIAYMADNFCKDAERALRARLDFKGLGKEEE